MRRRIIIGLVLLLVAAILLEISQLIGPRNWFVMGGSAITIAIATAYLIRYLRGGTTR